MAEPVKISTNKYNKQGKVDIDGNIWSVVLPGAGTELKMSKMKRRQEFLAKKIEDGTVTEDELDKYDDIEDFFYEFFQNLFQDGTEDNKSVREWVDKTPMAVILQAFEDIKDQANKTEE